MNYTPVTAVEIPTDRLTIYLNTKEDLDAIESERRFVATAGDVPSYFAITDTAIYIHPYPTEGDADATLYGAKVLKRARTLAAAFIASYPAKLRAQDFEVEEFLREKGEDFDEQVCKLTGRMINTELSERPIEPGEQLVDVKAEKAYLELLAKAAESIAKVPAYRNSDGEMAKTMIIKRYIADNDLPIRNRNAHHEIKALIQAYYS